MPSILKTTQSSSKRRKSIHEPTPSKKRKLQFKLQPNGNGKQRAYERDTIPIPNLSQSEEELDDYSLSEEDVEFFQENMPGFLTNLDTKAISRSKKETMRLHAMSKSQTFAKRKQSPLLSSTDEDSDFSSLSETDRETSDIPNDAAFQKEDSLEQAYESKSRILTAVEGRGGIPRLPIKLSNGRIVKTGHRPIPDEDQSEGHQSDSLDSKGSSSELQQVEDVATGARFGRPAVTAVLDISSRQLRIQTAKEEMARICQDILADPENSLGLLRRLQSFTLPRVSSVNKPEGVENDPLIRQLAMISQLAVLKDIIPSYRIRPLTDAEKNEKVSQMVLRTREWEQGLVSVYQAYLRSLETEIKKKTNFVELALKSMCTLLTEVTHFNFRSNIINAIVSELSKKKWDNISEMCSQALISVFKSDQNGAPSLEIVRTMNRMIKERHYLIHPNVFSCLLHLRLKSDLSGIRASETTAQAEHTNYMSLGNTRRKRAKGKKVDQPHLSKKAKKVFKERKEIEQQLREAEAEVDQEEKANMQTETLKLLFVLYFRILKLPGWSPLLPPALEGISRHAHMVNVDFFQDLMNVLKDLVSRSPEVHPNENLSKVSILGYKLLCTITAFELLTGQGEALNIDLRDFYLHLYNLIIPISLEASQQMVEPILDLLFRGLSLAFPARSGGVRSPIRTAAFAKRLLSASLLLPTSMLKKALDFVEVLISNEPKLFDLLSTEDRAINGSYRVDVDEPELCNPFATCFWELAYLANTYRDKDIRRRAKTILELNV